MTTRERKSLQSSETDPSTASTPSPASASAFEEGGAGLSRWVAPGVWAIALAKLALHLVTAALGGYGYFRDELYYLACADHPAWGYVDQPPLSIWVLGAWRAVAGDSIFALRFLPALAGVATLLLVARLAKEMGAGAFGQTLAALGYAVSVIALAFSSFYSMNAFDHLLWAAALLLWVRLGRGETPRGWLVLGAVLGLGLLNKVGVLWLGVGMGLALLATERRRSLTTRWPWLGVAVALLLFLPYVLWNGFHGWPHLEFIGNALAGKYSGLSIASFLAGQLLLQNPLALPLWLAGLGALLFARPLSEHRGLAWIFLAVTALLLLNGNSKAEYLSPAYAPLWAAGGVVWESWTVAGWRSRLRPVLVSMLLLGLALLPMVVPVLPVESFIAYSGRLALSAPNAEGKQEAELPQFYADMFGWPEKAEAVARAFRALPEEERSSVAIYGGNYGRAGAIDFFGEALGLPKAISGHNSYWMWGPPSPEPTVYLVLGGNEEELGESFTEVRRVETATCDYCMPYERDLGVFLCRGPRMPLSEAWEMLKSFG